MADFGTHGLQAASAFAVLGHVLGLPQDLVIAGAGYGFITGAWADVHPLVRAVWQKHILKLEGTYSYVKFFKWQVPYDWYLYDIYHKDTRDVGSETGGWKYRWLRYSGGGTLHWLTDKWFHTIPGENWFKRLWWLWFLMMISGIAPLLWLFLR